MSTASYANGFGDVEIWKKTHQFVLDVYRLKEAFVSLTS